jgi:putative DNA primase/helicase
MLELAQGLPELRANVDLFDKQKCLLNTETATLNLVNGEPRDFAKTDYLTKMAAVAFDAKAHCPRWEKFLHEVTEDDSDLEAFLRRSVGYCLTGITTEQCFWIVFGSGSNGKTTFLETILALLGDYGCQVKTEVLLDGGYEQKDYHLAELYGRRLVVACESDASRKLATGLLKQASGGEQVIARRPYELPFSFYPEFKIWLSTNYKPRVNDASNAIWRRIHAVPFRACFAKRGELPARRAKPADTSLREQLKKELPGILNWAISGCLEWQEIGLSPPKTVLEATQQYRQDEDLLGTFIEDCCVVRNGAFETANALYLAYVSWCRDSGEDPGTQKTFGGLLDNRGFRPDRNSKARIWHGIELRQ